LETSNKFGRWWRGFCRIFQEVIIEETGEKQIPYTFYPEIMPNPMITNLLYDIVQARN